MFITKMALPRRTFLRGMGITLSLPFLDAMVPALTALAKTPATPKARLGCIYIPNGYIESAWIPPTTGAGFELTSSLSPLAGVKDRLVVLSGLDHREANSKGDGNGDHPRATAVWLTGVHAWATADGVSGRPQLGTSVDQIAAQEIGKDTALPSLELGLEYASQITCDAGDCFYSNSIAWRTPTTPLTPEAHPRVVFERLFGDGGNAASRLQQMRQTNSILDSVTREVATLQTGLGSSDRGKLTEYLDAVRDIEQRIQGAETHGLELGELPERPIDIPEMFEDHAKLMFDLQVIAYQADLTRVFTMMMGREASPTAFPQIGLPEQHHSLSHHLNNPVLMAKKAKIDQHLISQLAYFLERLRDTPDGDGSLLDHSLILYGGGLGNSNLHMHTNLPCLLAGGAAGTVKGGRHIQCAAGTPMANLLLSMLDRVGVPTPEKIGDSTQHLAEL